jgi:hypothetical protein
MVLALLALAPSVHAGSHLWRFSEFYSSPDRSIQFIEMQEIGGSQIETNISEHWYQTNGYNLDRSKKLGTDLPFGTANKKFLVGSQSYAALAATQPGLPAPDYVIDDGAINPAGDTVLWWFYQTKAIPPGVMPSDGINSIHVIDPTNTNSGYTVGPNSPTNFAGETGSVGLPAGVPATPWPATLLLLSLACGALLLRARVRSASGAQARR